MITQLPLNFDLNYQSNFDNFYTGSNMHIVNNSIYFIDSIQESTVFLWGEEGVGKTHLLQAACHRAIKNGSSSVYIPLQYSCEMCVDLLNGLENISLICIDDINKISTHRLWEEALFHLFNKIKFSNVRLFVSSSQSLSSLNLYLDDLKSRLSSSIIYKINKLDDSEKLLLMQLKAKQKGLILDIIVGKFLMSRCTRNIQDLFMNLDKLDKASLIKNHRLTVPFVKKVLKL